MAEEAQKPTLPSGPIPRHIAIIMDGNGRWAERRGLMRFEGHVQGAKSVREVTTAAREAGVEALTLYAFSVQNWSRPDEEIQRLMELLLEYLVSEPSTIMDNDIRLQGIGQIDRLPEQVQRQLAWLENESRNNRSMVLTLALSYGGREELVEACRRIARDVAAGRISPDDIDERLVSDCTFTGDLPELDLLIRTSGEMRLSNFLLWQCAYAELVVTDTLWPDFSRRELYRSIERYRARERRFGMTAAQIAEPQDAAPEEAVLKAP